jgi:hypothetical protein
MIFLEFERMAGAAIRADDDLMADFRAVHGGILAALLDDMVAVSMRMSSVDATDVQSYRFVNYGRVMVALDRLYGIEPDAGHLAAVVATASDAQTERVWDAPDLVAVMRVVAVHSGRWRGENSDLLDDMRAFRPADADRSTGPWWPASPQHLGTRLRNQQHALSLAGLRIDFGKSNGRRVVRLALADDLVAKLSAPASIAEIDQTRTGSGPFGAFVHKGGPVA